MILKINFYIPKSKVASYNFLYAIKNILFKNEIKTTIEALKVLNDRNVPEAIFDAMAACTKRAEELGNR